MNSNDGHIDKARSAFSEIYEKNIWALGPDLELESAGVERFVGLLSNFIRSNDVTTVAEFGCGYWVYSKLIDWSDVRYDGYDVVEKIIDFDNKTFSNKNVHFHLVKDGLKMKGADLLICKDVFQHLPNEDIIFYMKEFKTLFKYMIITNDTYPDHNTNVDILCGGYRSVRLDREPFNERCAVLQRWDGVSFGQPWTKHSCLVFGNATAGVGAQTVLSNRTAPPSEYDESQGHVPPAPHLARFVRWIRGLPFIGSIG